MKTIIINVPTISKSDIVNTLARVRRPFTRIVTLENEVIVEKEIVNTKTITKEPYLIIGKNHTLNNGVTLTIQSMDINKTVMQIYDADPSYNCGDIYLVESITEDTRTDSNPY